MSRRRLLAVGLSAVTAAVVAVAVDPHFERPGWFFYDSLQRLTAPAKAKGVTFVAISAASLQQMRESAENSYGWPWPRSLYGAFVRVAKHSGAASITFDGLFASPSTEGVEDDRAFGTAIKESGIAVAVGRAAGEHAEAVNGEISGAAAGAIREGIVSVPLEADGVFRRIPLTTQGHPTLGFATLASTPEFERRRSETMWPRFYADHGIPLVEASEMFRLFRAIDDGKPIEGEFAEIAAKLKGSHLIVGASAPGLQDLKPLPTEPNAPGALIHATALANARAPLRRARARYRHECMM
ncbi:MAG: CHASE2 domain-containing protein [Bdellovibrionota bacterium]